MNIRKQRLLIFFVPLLLALPFLQRAYFVDDNYFVEIATWLKDHPTLPYHFRTDDAGLQNRGWEENGFVRMVNPLVHHYYLACLLKIGGAREWFLRLGCVLLSCFSALFLFGLARRQVRHPFFATLLILLTPAFWLSSYSLLIDSTLGFFFFGGLYAFVRADEKGEFKSYALSGFLMGMAILTKYPGVFILPVSLLWLILKGKKKSPIIYPIISWVVALAFLGFYSWATARLYGEPHILAASKRMVHTLGLAKFFVFLVFFSGVTLLPVLAWKWIGHKRAILAGASVVMLMLFLSSQYGGYSLEQGFLLGFWFVTTGVFFWLLIKNHAFFSQRDDIFLWGWIGGFMLMMVFVMDWVAARYYIMVIPAVIFILVRLIEAWEPHALLILKRCSLLMLVCTSILAYADYSQAEPSRRVGGQLNADGFGPAFPGRRFYLGDSFTMSYLKNDGWVPAFPDTEFNVGDLILSKEVTMPPIWPWQSKIAYKELKAYSYSTSFPVKVMDYEGSAGFYASVWGALPFTFSRGPWERFGLYEVTQVYAPDISE